MSYDKKCPWATTINRDNDNGIGWNFPHNSMWISAIFLAGSLSSCLQHWTYSSNNILPLLSTIFPKRINVGINGREKVINISSRKNSILPSLWRTLYPQNQSVFSKESEILWTIILIERFQWKKIVIEVAFQRPMDYNSFDIFFFIDQNEWNSG